MKTAVRFPIQAMLTALCGTNRLRPPLTVLVLLCILVTGCKTEWSGKEKGKDPPVAAPVAIDTLRRGTITSFVRFNSVVEASREVDVYARTVGQITSLFVEEGQTVAAGQKLCLIDDAEQRLALFRAEGELSHQSDEWKRAVDLAERGMLPEGDLKRIELARSNAEIAVEQARLLLNWTRISAPIGGLVTSRLVDAGDRVDMARPLFRIIDRSRLWIHIWLSESEAAVVGPNTSIGIVSLADSTIVGRATLDLMGEVVDPTFGKIKARFLLEGSSGRFRPGQFVECRLLIATHVAVLVAPKRAILYESGRPFVFVVNDSIAYKRPVELGLATGGSIEIGDGVEEGELIVIDGQATISDSAKVRIVQ
ncbi:MAG: efflux RND transporter periplasmic adaptor subunit [Calditrichaeota bacterium]|nr:efflux RND transporter periplasmic adaptor subunit [Calditrichota bacterium]